MVADITPDRTLLVSLLVLLAIPIVVQYSVTRFRLWRATLREPRDERCQTLRDEPVKLIDDERLLVERIGFFHQCWLISPRAVEELSEREIDLLAEMRMVRTGPMRHTAHALKLGGPGVIAVFAMTILETVLDVNAQGSLIGFLSFATLAFGLVSYFFVVFPLLERRRIYRMDDTVADEYGHESLASLIERLRETNGEYPTIYTLLLPSMQQRIDRLRETER